MTNIPKRNESERDRERERERERYRQKGKEREKVDGRTESVDSGNVLKQHGERAYLFFLDCFSLDLVNVCCFAFAQNTQWTFFFIAKM